MRNLGGVVVAVVALGLGLAAAAGAQQQQQPPVGPEVPAGPAMRGPGMRLGPAGPWARRGPGQPGGVDFYLGDAERLGLSEAQLAELRSRMFAFEKARVKQRALLETAQIELQELRSAASPDAGKVEAKIREVFAKRADEAVAVFAAQVEADKVLTEAQRAQVRHPGPPRMRGAGNRGEARPPAK